jgi:hypothetical protein
MIAFRILDYGFQYPKFELSVVEFCILIKKSIQNMCSYQKFIINRTLNNTNSIF